MGHLFSSYFSCCARTKISYFGKHFKRSSTIFSSTRLPSSMKLRNFIQTKSKDLQHLRVSGENICKYVSTESDCINPQAVYSCAIKPKKMPRYGDEEKYRSYIQNEVPPDQPVNRSSVLIRSVILKSENDKNTYLPLGTILNIISQTDDCLYVQTPNNEKGYVDEKSCIPLGALSPPSVPAPRPSTASLWTSEIRNVFSILNETQTRMNYNFNESDISFSESTFDFIYLQIVKKNKSEFEMTLNTTPEKDGAMARKSIVLIIKTDYRSTGKDTLSVRKGEIVLLVHCCVKGWYWVKKENNVEGFIPSITAGYCST